jgi:hypothetical protein
MELAFILFLFVFNVTFRERLEHFRIVSMVTTGDPRLKKRTRQGHLQTPEVVMEELGAIQVLLVKKHPALTIVMLQNVFRIS